MEGGALQDQRHRCQDLCVTVWARGHQGAGTSGSACERGKGVCLVGGGDARPVLVCERVTNSADGSPVLMSEHVYPGHLTAFTVDLPSAGRSETPAGLRLIE